MPIKPPARGQPRGQPREACSSYLSLAFNWLAKANLAAFSCNLANLFSYLDTFFERGLDEFALHVAYGHVELIDLEVTKDDLALKEEHLAFQVEPFVEVLFDGLLQLIVGGVFDVLLDATPLADDPVALGGLSFLFLF